MMTEPTEAGISKQPKELCHHWSQRILWCKIKVGKDVNILEINVCYGESFMYRELLLYLNVKQL